MENNGVNGVDLISGNTNPEIKYNKDDVKRNRWILVLNNYDSNDFEILKIWCEFNCKKFILGKEVGKQGTKHIQGYINTKKQYRWNELKKCLDNRIHFEPAVKPENNNAIYCSKDGDYVQVGLDKYIPRTIKIIQNLRPFQKTLEDYILNNEACGKIMWVYDKVGQLGKTEFLRYMFVKHKIPFSYGGKCSDIINLIFNNKDYFLSSDKPAVIYNFGRDTDNMKISYKSMEQISDGCISNTKFEAGCFVCNKVNVLVLANCKPYLSALTGSRWLIKKIGDDLELCDYIMRS